MMFNYVRNEKKKDYKNVILRYCENGFFKRVNPGFSSKI